MWVGFASTKAFAYLYGTLVLARAQIGASGPPSQPPSPSPCHAQQDATNLLWALIISEPRVAQLCHRDGIRLHHAVLALMRAGRSI